MKELGFTKMHTPCVKVGFRVELFKDPFPFFSLPLLSCDRRAEGSTGPLQVLGAITLGAANAPVLHPRRDHGPKAAVLLLKG